MVKTSSIWSASLTVGAICACGGEAAFVAPNKAPQHQFSRAVSSSSETALSMYVPGSAPSESRNGAPSKKSLAAMKAVAGTSSTMETNTLPQFKTAHGLLSPGYVRLLEENHVANGFESKEVDSFLSTYREQGPLACVPFLSDPVVLPALTKAMRDNVL
jgi:hypothetical protein